jgi:predicted dehydrogenase
MAPIRLIHVGVGGRGTWPVDLIAAQSSEPSPQFQSVAFVDISEDSLRAARETTGVSPAACFGSLSAALAAVESDAVMIVTSPGSHTALCLESVAAGKHLLVEKPFTKSLAEAVQIMDAADLAGVKVMVCQNDRFRSGADTLAALAASGSMGRGPYFGLMTRFGNRPSVKHSGEDDHAYLWERGIHDLDSICHMFGSTPSKIFCDSFNPPWSPYKGGSGVNGWIEFDSGARCSLLLTFMDSLPRPEDGGKGSRPTFAMAPGGGSTGGCRMDFEHGVAEFVGQLDVDDLGGRWHVHRTGSNSNEPEVLDPPRPSEAEPEALLMAEFYGYVNGGAEPPCSGETRWPFFQTFG